MKEATKTVRCRIIVGATSYADASPAIGLAVHLASELDGQIDAYLMEDEAIMNYASMPFARTMLIGANAFVRVTPEAMQAAFRRDAQIFRDAIARAAQVGALHWTFQQKRGGIRNLFLPDIGEQDILVIGRQRLPGSAGDLILLDDASLPGNRQYALALRTARRLKVPLHVLIWAANATDADRRQAELFGSLPSPGVAVSFSTGTDFDRTVLRTISRESPSALFLNRSLAERIDLDRLLDTARCPVMIVAG